MDPIVRTAKAFSDETRLRALVAPRDGELSLCPLVCRLKLAPSTASKHLDILCQAGLVRRRKAGRWACFRLGGHDDSSAGPLQLPGGRTGVRRPWTQQGMAVYNDSARPGSGAGPVMVGNVGAVA